MTDAKSEAAQAAAADSSTTNTTTPGSDGAQPARDADAAGKSGHDTGASTPAVRFSSAVQEFSPADADASTIQEPAADDANAPAELPEVTPEQLKAFTKSLHGPLLQERRLNTYQFEAFSLPPSRVSFFSMYFAAPAIGKLRVADASNTPTKPRDNANATASRFPLARKTPPIPRAFTPPSRPTTTRLMEALASPPWPPRRSRRRALPVSDEPETSARLAPPAVTHT